jgi:hypothetical protein
MSIDIWDRQFHGYGGVGSRTLSRLLFFIFSYAAIGFGHCFGVYYLPFLSLLLSIFLG